VIVFSRGIAAGGSVGAGFVLVWSGELRAAGSGGRRAEHIEHIDYAIADHPEEDR
jgi:hypothetical protein